MSSRSLFLLLFLISSSFFSLGFSDTSTSIIFTTLGRSRYTFDIFTAHITPSTLSSAAITVQNELQLTDGISVNYNGFFPSNPSSLLPNFTTTTASYDALLYITESSGSPTIYLDLLPSSAAITSNFRREALQQQLSSRIQVPLLPLPDADSSPSMKDRPSASGDHLIYVSTHQPNPSPRQSWAAVYSTHLPTRRTRRLTPSGVADFSPAVSPSGLWTAVASSGTRGWSGEVQELNTSIHIFRTVDGSDRVELVEHGGWPCWADDSTLYFHRRSSDGWWSVYRATLSTTTAAAPAVISIDRITPPGFHAFTPAAAAGAPWLLAVATRRPTSQFRHIELVHIGGSGSEGNTYIEVTRPFSPNSHHYNPFLSPDASRVGYHRCRGGRSGGSPPLLLENIQSPSPETFSLLRIDGSFPSFSPDGSRIAYVRLPGLFVVNSDGSGERREVFTGNAFGTAWDWKRRGVIYTSYGPGFSTESTRVDIISISLHDEPNLEPTIKKLTINGENNAFPSPSPDGRWLVFRSGRSGHKNLYIMDAEVGETGGLSRLTEGPWSDTMCNWSPDGEWIAFASDRHNPGGGSFAIYMVHPNGTGLRRVVHSGDGGRTNHPWFSPDSKSLVFTSDYAGVSAEPIANPHHYQPYGEIFTVNIDGSDIRRLTHNSFEDGTPTWTPYYLKPADVAESLHGNDLCSFDDCHWLQLLSQLNSVSPRNSC